MASWVETQKLLRKHSELLKTGTVLAIDPSSGGGISRPGWAYFMAGQLVKSGTIPVQEGLSLQRRLYEMSCWVNLLALHTPIELMVIEDIKIIRGQFSGPSVYNLLKGVGALMSAISVDACLEIPPKVWTRIRDEDYEKSDENDAIYLGKFAIGLATGEYSLASEPKKKTASRKKPSTKRVNLNWNSSKKKAAKWKKLKAEKLVASLTTSQPASPPGKRKSKRSKS